MSMKKKILMGGAISVLTVGLLYGGYKGYEYYTAKELVATYETKTFPNIKVNGQDVSNLSKKKLTRALEKEVEKFATRSIEIKIDEHTFTKTLDELGLTIEENLEKLADEIFTLGKDLELIKQAKRIKEAPLKEYQIDYSYDETLIDGWLETIANELYVEVEEPTLTMVSAGNFEVTGGRDGYRVETAEIEEQIKKALNKSSTKAVKITAEGVVTHPQRDKEALASVNHRISSYSSTFPAGIPRARNVELATSKINKTVLMPGDEFSYTEKVSPVIYSNGYVDATVFINSKPVDGVGGGICQVSSTLYNTVLKAGILPTERRNHSLPVGYVPSGLDATMAEDLIDFKFVNTLDYPIYINAYTSGGTLTIDFWSHESALNGVTYKPQVRQLAANKYQTSLLGYDAAGNVVFNKYIDTSVYK